MEPETINVAVTGNAPFWDWDFNTSLLVRDALPNCIERAGKRKIVVRKYARVTRDTYDDVRRVSKDIWNGQRSLFLPVPKDEEVDDKVDVDFILHLGMETRGVNEYCFETKARRDGYEQAGDDKKTIDSKQLKAEGLPAVLKTYFDVEAAWKRVKHECPQVQTRASDDAGLYFCEFRLYSSLAEAEQHHPSKHGMVLFQHLPQRHDAEGIKLSTKVTAAYISALADDKVLIEGK